MHGCIELQIICIACSMNIVHSGGSMRSGGFLIFYLLYILSYIYVSGLSNFQMKSLILAMSPILWCVSNTVMCWPNAICNTVQYCPLLSNTVQYCPILSNTVQYWPNVICTDDAQTILWVSICRHNWTQSCRTQLNNTTQSCTTHNPIRLAQFNSLRHTNGQCATTEWNSVQAVRVSAVHCLVSSVYYLVSSVQWPLSS